MAMTQLVLRVTHASVKMTTQVTRARFGVFSSHCEEFINALLCVGAVSEGSDTPVRNASCRFRVNGPLCLSMRLSEPRYYVIWTVSGVAKCQAGINVWTVELA